MYATFHINGNELDETFFKKLKAMFKDKRIAISVEEEQDETEYLLATEANRRHLTESLEQAKRGELVRVKTGKKAAK